MNIHITFNWPPPDLARVSLGMANVKDHECLFRVGIIDKKDPEIIRWFKNGWVESEDFEKTPAFDLSKDHIVRVEVQNKETKKTTQFQIDIAEKWPPEAQGNSSTDISWTF